MEKTNRVKPHLTLLTSGQIEQIHHFALQILSRTGVWVDSEPVRELLKKSSEQGPLKKNRAIPR